MSKDGLALCVNLFLDGQLATVVAALATDSVELDRSAAVGAYADCRSDCLVVGPALVATGLGMVSLRMCHFFFCLLVNRSVYYSCLAMGGRSRILVRYSLPANFLRASHLGSVC